MRVLLVGPDFEENLSIRYLSASLQTVGHEAELATFNSPADENAVVAAANNADLVGLSMCFQSRAMEFLRLARSIKKRDPQKLVVAGGHYASCAAEPLLLKHPELDVIVLHEGEKTLLEIADSTSRLTERLPEIPGIAYRDGQRVRFTPPRRTLDDLDTLPFPDRRGPIHFIAGVPTSYMMGSRGCYGNCAYCCITTLHRISPGKRFRQRNVDRIADEMLALYQQRGARQFVFHDDNFLVPSESLNLARIDAFAKALRSRKIENIALVIKCRPADASRKVLRRLKELGLVRVFMGVESATEQGLAALERTQHMDDSIRALESCGDLNISAQFTIMTFHPEATPDTLRSDIAFMRRFCGNPLNFCRAEIYAGTPLEKRMLDQGRARGNYLAREYSLVDPAADLACEIALDVFHARCWANGSLMQNSIGLDHTAAVARRFYGRRASEVCQRTAKWLRSVNQDTIDLLEEVVDLTTADIRDAGLQRAIRALKDRESSNRNALLSEGMRLSAELQSLRLTAGPPKTAASRFTRRAAAAVLAIGIPTLPACQVGCSEYAARPLQQGPTQPPPPGIAEKDLCSLSGTVTDATGTAIAGASVSIMNLDTGQVTKLTTDASGAYLAKDLRPGRYTIKAEFQNFKTAVVKEIQLQAGELKRNDIKLEIGSFPGCCEYAAAPMQVVPEDLTIRKKPFNYTVGERDDSLTLQGVAKLVYGDPKMWVQIFEANRDVLAGPGPVRPGTNLVIPPAKREVPKLISKVMPTYPPEAIAQHVSGDVVLDVTLKEDGTVDHVDVIDGNPLLAKAAIDAIKQWRYQPLLIEGKAVLKFVAIVSFQKGGKIRTR